MNPTKPWVVMKFGGTSVGNPAYWPSILDALLACRKQGVRPFVVCSALSGVSDLLEDLLDAFDRGDQPEPYVAQLRQRHLEFGAELGLDVTETVEQYLGRMCRSLERERGHDAGPVSPRNRARVMAMGEFLSTLIGAEWLRGQGLDVAWKDARGMLEARPAPMGACESQAFLSATCHYEFDEELRRGLDAETCEVVVTQGFIARNPGGETVLLGRGGSDTAAAYLAAKIGAERLEIWTDVPGLFTTNPHDISQARLLRTLSYDEAETLAGHGAKVLHAPCIQPARDARLPLHIRWTSDPSVQGTIVSPVAGGGEECVKAVSSRDNLCLISMERRAGWQPVGFMADVATCFKKHALSMDLLASSAWTIQATLDLGARSGIEDRIPGLLEDLKQVCKPTITRDVASVSLVGCGIRSYLHELGPTWAQLRQRDLLMIAPAGNDLTLSFVVPRDETDALLESLHAKLFGGEETNGTFGPTWEELNSAGDGITHTSEVAVVLPVS
jgi:diaminopimelate decarboxylase/aspartate kinase